MIVIQETMDPKSRNFERNGKRIGMIQWHGIPVISLNEYEELTIKEMRAIIRFWENGRK